MSKRSIPVMPGTQEILSQMGEQIKLARLRRELSAELVAERAGISRATLWNIEKGSPSVAVGAYAAVLHALNNMDRDTKMNMYSAVSSVNWLSKFSSLQFIHLTGT